MQRLPLIALLLASCAAPRGPWVVQGTVDSATASQALAIVEAARRVAGPSALDGGGRVVLLPSLDGFAPCTARPGNHLSGCCACGGTQSTVYVLWPHPRCPAGADLTCSALAHELGHVISLDEGRSDAFGLLVVQEWRRDLP